MIEKNKYPQPGTIEEIAHPDQVYRNHYVLDRGKHTITHITEKRVYGHAGYYTHTLHGHLSDWTEVVNDPPGSSWWRVTEKPASS